MKVSLLNYTRISAVFLCFIGLVSCAIKESNEATKKIPVSWNTGFTMPVILASSDISLNSISDLSKLNSAPWYADVNVRQTKVGETVFSSCADYFDKAEPSTHTIRDNEMNAYLEFKIMCEATQLLINAKDSKESFLPDIILNDDVPKLWPKKIALQISTEESRRITHNPKLKTWNDVTPIIKIEKRSETKSIYFHDGGYQEIEILGNGDANSDGIEDVFIVVRDHVEGGNYFNIRLFVLSINAKGNWELIKDF
ncbi:MAG: hypothetical protein GY777_20200 [Candidatus Brocadiaceae bacterium]|nr:hypothetical protein [Candidatus Brocadiaceae bacterium]